jgi:hypothetical protein
VITNIYNKKTKEPTSIELFTATGELKTFFTRVRQEHEYRIDVCRVTRGAHIKHLYLSKKVFSFPVAVNNSIDVGPLVFLL